MKYGIRRLFKDGRVIVNNSNGIRVMLFKDCMVIAALDREGMGTLSLLGSVGKNLETSKEVKIYRDGSTDIHLIEIYYS